MSYVKVAKYFEPCCLPAGHAPFRTLLYDFEHC